MNYKETVENLAEKSGIGKPEVYSSWVFMRAAGLEKTEASNEIGCSRNTLTRYETRAREGLTRAERFRLLCAAFNYEYRERIGEVNL